MDRSIFFFHGLESGPHGRKYRRLSEHFDVESPDFQGMDIWQRLEKAEKLTEGRRNLVVVGSSLGGRLAAQLYARHPDRLFGYVLAAPALHRSDLDEIDVMPHNAAVVHGTADDVVPLEPVRTFCAARGVTVTEVDDDHRLADSLHVLIEKTEELVQKRAAA